MHILFVADGRSPTTRRWIQGVRALQHEITLVSTFPCDPLPEALNTIIFPVAFSNYAAGNRPTQATNSNPTRRLIKRFRAVFLAARAWLGPLTLPGLAPRFRKLVEQIQPDAVHALRIPFEGMLAAYTPADIPLILSIWGNDLTLHAPSSPWMRSRTIQTLRRANGLIADAQRDIRLARQWGYPYDRPTLVVPGNGGIDLAGLRREAGTAAQMNSEQSTSKAAFTLPEGPLVINPRGLRAYVRNDTFFQAIPLVLEHNPQVHFLCTSMADQAEALGWVSRLRLDERVHLLPTLSQAELWNLMMRSDVAVSISSHDGTPNSLLESMACGCFPIVGDLESLREWITPGRNGLLVEPGKPQGLASAILLALDSPSLRQAAAETNLRMVQERTEVNLVRAQIQVFYQRCHSEGQRPER
ncbi:MAG TPA: glycosyltransferase [Anaerolineaceae bacterium]|nr:glycosyltransferase [Anaerolineaceae bacterium]